MTLGIALNYFRYFLHFPRYEGESKFRFITSRRAFLSEHIPDMTYVDWREYPSASRKAAGDVDALFAASRKLGLVPSTVDYDTLCAFYEQTYEKFFKNQNIDLFLSGGVTGFERVGLATAQRMGIKTLCVWEGMFRPWTLSADPKGMNSEASIAGTNFSDILKHIPSNEFERLWEKIVSRDSIAYATRPDLQEILGDRFDIFKQTNNRIADRMDIERIRIPFLQLAGARMSYYSFRHRYRPVDAVQGQFIFFPLQTHTDSNVLINTQFGSVDAFLQLILPAFTIFHKRTGIRLAIKEHPIDVFRKRYIRRNSDGVIWIDPATSVSQILHHANCRATLVLNSTSGLESLIQQKPVICLGNALYRYPELVEIPEMLTTDSLIASLEKITDRKVDGAAVRQFCSFLSDRTQIEGNIDSTPSEGDVRCFMRSIQNRIQKKFL